MFKIRKLLENILFRKNNKPSWNLHRYRHLINLVKERKPSTMIEIGVWKGERSIEFINKVPSLSTYVGFDLFEDLTSETLKKEYMGKCAPQNKEVIEERIKDNITNTKCSIRLIKGLTYKTLPDFLNENDKKFDFIYIDGGHSLETIYNDWSYSEKLLNSDGIAIFDDYILNDFSRGAKPLIDQLIKENKYKVRFFPMIEDGLENLQITMAIVEKKY